MDVESCTILVVVNRLSRPVVVLDRLPGLYGLKYDSVTACGPPLYLCSYKLVGSATPGSRPQTDDVCESRERETGEGVGQERPQACPSAQSGALWALVGCIQDWGSGHSRLLLTSVPRLFGSTRVKNRHRSRTPKFPESKTKAEPKNRTTDYSVRFGVRFSVKKCPG